MARLSIFGFLSGRRKLRQIMSVTSRKMTFYEDDILPDEPVGLDERGISERQRVRRADADPAELLRSLMRAAAAA
jgi:hypothetical protein